MIGQSPNDQRALPWNQSPLQRVQCGGPAWGVHRAPLSRRARADSPALREVLAGVSLEGCG